MCLGFFFSKQTYQKPKGYDAEGTEDLIIIKPSYLWYRSANLICNELIEGYIYFL